MQNMKAEIQTSVMSMVTGKLQEALNTNITPVPEQSLNNDPAPMADGPSSINSRAAGNVLQDRNNVQSVQLSTTFHTLGDEVPDRIKSQIWANEYVDLARLLNTDSQEEVELRVRQTDSGNQIDLVPQNKKTLSSITSGILLSPLTWLSIYKNGQIKLQTCYSTHNL